MSDAVEEQALAEIALTWKTDPSELPAVYANMVAATLTPDEVTLTFAQRTVPQKGKEGLILPVAKAAIPLSVLPRLIEVLQNLHAMQQGGVTTKSASKKRQR